MLKQSNVFYSQPSIQEALAKFYLSTWTVEPGGCTPLSPPVFAKFLQNLPLLQQVLAFLCLQPQLPHVPASPRTFKFTPPSMFYNFWFKFYVAPTRLSTSYAYLTLKALKGVKKGVFFTPPQVFSRYLRNEWRFFNQILAIPSL